MAGKWLDDQAPRVRLPGLGGKPVGKQVFGGKPWRARGMVDLGTYWERFNAQTTLTRRR